MAGLCFDLREFKLVVTIYLDLDQIIYIYSVFNFINAQETMGALQFKVNTHTVKLHTTYDGLNEAPGFLASH